MMKKYPEGYFRSPDQRQVAVRFPVVLFEQIIEMAKHENKTFNDMVISLIECGKLCLDESDKLELT